MKLINKKSTFAFGVSLIIFSLAALVIAALLSIGRGGLFGSGEKIKHGVGDPFNLLLVMTDYSPEKFDDYDRQSVENVFDSASDGTGTRKIRAESMLLVRFDPSRSEITLTPLSGNTRVSVKGEETTLDMVASHHGTNLLVEKIRAMTGLEIDRYAVFTPESASNAIDLIGSFKYKIKGDLVWQDTALGIDINIESGRQTFDGKKTVELIRYYSYPSTYIDKDKILLDFAKKFMKFLTDDFTYEELCGIMSSISKTAYVSEELTEEQIGRIGNSGDFSVRLLHVKGSFDDRLRFIPDEKATLEEFKPYRRIYS